MLKVKKNIVIAASEPQSYVLMKKGVISHHEIAGQARNDNA